jgi:hypothetical protein
MNKGLGFSGDSHRPKNLNPKTAYSKKIIATFAVI